MQRVVLQRDSLTPKLGRRLDERTADVAILDEPFAERNAAPARVTDRGRYCAVGHRNHDVGRGGGPIGEGLAHTLARRVDGDALEGASGGCERDGLEHTESTAAPPESRHRPPAPHLR